MSACFLVSHLWFYTCCDMLFHPPALPTTLLCSISLLSVYLVSTFSAWSEVSFTPALVSAAWSPRGQAWPKRDFVSLWPSHLRCDFSCLLRAVVINLWGGLLHFMGFCYCCLRAAWKHWWSLILFWFFLTFFISAFAFSHPAPACKWIQAWHGLALWLEAEFFNQQMLLLKQSLIAFISWSSRVAA